VNIKQKILAIFFAVLMMSHFIPGEDLSTHNVLQKVSFEAQPITGSVSRMSLWHMIRFILPPAERSITDGIERIQRSSVTFGKSS